MQRVRPVLSLPIVLLAVSAACKPTNAELTSGGYAAFLSTTNSRTVLEERIDIAGEEIAYGVDCRTGAANPVEGALPEICEDEAWPFDHEAWAGIDGYNVMGADMEAWRGEGIITSENDFQVVFHHALPGGDFRFVFVLDPVLAPKECRSRPDGTVGLEPIDGDWVSEWSNDLAASGEDGQLFFLNARSYQFNPNDTEQLWVLPQEWRAGFAAGKFGAEDLTLRTAQYGLPVAYDNFESATSAPPASALFYREMEPGSDPRSNNGFQSVVRRAQEVKEEIQAEFQVLSQGQFDTLMGGDFAYEPRVHANEWRIPDSRASGLDGWAELHYNWVRLDPGADLTVGGTASGEFHLMFVANESPTRVIVRGRFNVPVIKRDRWAPRNVEAEKMEENGATFCGG